MGTLSEEVRTEILCGRICDLEAENAKLRRLCGTFWAALKGDPEDRWSEDECPLVLCEHMFECEDECVFEREMRELGMDV